MKEIYFAKKRLYAHTSHIVEGNAFIIVQPEVVNDTDKDIDVWVDIHMHQLIDNGAEPIDEVPGIMAAGHVKLHVPANSSKAVRTMVCVENAQLWSQEQPTMYVVEGVLYKPVPEGEALPNPKLMAGLAMREPHSMKMLDFAETRFGIRSIWADAKNGFTINGKKADIKLGTLDSTRSENFQDEYKRVSDFKTKGTNAVVIDRATQSEFFLDCCDRLGIIVFDTVADIDIVKEDRNHPCVVAWNIVKSEQSKDSFAEVIREADATRPVGGICDAAYGMVDDKFDVMAWYDNTETVCAAWDYVGYPDEDMRLDAAKILFANRLMFSFK